MNGLLRMVLCLVVLCDVRARAAPKPEEETRHLDRRTKLSDVMNHLKTREKSHQG